MSELLDLPPVVPSEPAGTGPELVRLEARDTAVIVIETPMEAVSQTIGEAICEVEAVVGAEGVALTGPPFARYLGMGPEVRAEVGFPIGTAIAPTGRVQPGRLPGGEAARIVHVGPYDTLGDSYGRLQGWIAARGRTMAGPFWEVYWTDPTTDPEPATWQTEVLAPLRPVDG